MKTDPEVWKPVFGFEGQYEVSSLGELRVVERIHVRSNGRSILIRQRVMRPCDHNGGYRRYRLMKDGRVHWASANRIVAFAFRGVPSEPNMVAMHLNNIKSDNREVNIAWGTPMENQRQRVADGTSNRGERNVWSVLTDDQVVALRIARSEGASLADLALQYSVTMTAISKICTGNTWTHVGGPTKPAKPKSEGRKISADDVIKILDLRNDGVLLRVIADLFGITPGYVCKLARAA